MPHHRVLALKLLPPAELLARLYAAVQGELIDGTADRVQSYAVDCLHALVETGHKAAAEAAWAKARADLAREGSEMVRKARAGA